MAPISSIPLRMRTLAPDPLNIRSTLAQTYTSLLSSIFKRAARLQPFPLSPSTLRSPLHRRKVEMVSIPSTYTGMNSSPGAVVGIVLGTVAAFILVVYLLFIFFGPREDPLLVEQSESSVSSLSSRHHRRRRPDVIEVHEESTLSPSEDIVEVFEEDSVSSPRRTYSKRGSYRTVDPSEYGGGRRSIRHVR
ncbi:hypothetical protein AJ80_07624 [Polytolypa hystricis UAMH7299]|uniref:Uncharacterized protein n=1 Tax=Polytolypa hystricis (strain UAMH7299) TaxID=1447883 RepID=A0A2B7XMN4_POLH7|nr:hypothetical protein AJ80_07624 [Polytolypa hystricis UAMH7299]